MSPEHSRTHVPQTRLERDSTWTGFAKQVKISYLMAYRDWSLYSIGKYKADLEDLISSPKILGGIHPGEKIHSEQSTKGRQPTLV